MKNSSLIKERLSKLLREEINNQLQKKPLQNQPPKKTSNLDLYLEKIPSLKNAVEKVLTPNYKHFLVDANVISPKPFTVRFKTKNGYHLELFLKDGSYKCKVSGKKYDLNTEGEIEKASDSITELLGLGKPQPIQQPSEDENAFDDLDSGKGSGLGGNFGSASDTEPTGGGDEDIFKPIEDKGQQNIDGAEDTPKAKNS